MKKTVFIATVMLMAMAVLPLVTSGCGGSKNAPWNPFDVKSGQYYRYGVSDLTMDKQGWISVRIKEKEGELEGQWEGEVGGEALSATTQGVPGRFVEFSRPALTTIPGTTPLLSTVLAPWWENLKGFEFKTGAEWSVALGEMMPASFVVYVEGSCEIAGHEGYSARFKSGQTLMMETCVSPDLALPLQARTYDTAGNVQYEAQLEDYSSGR